MGPIDYSSQVQDPFQAAAQGYQFGAAVRNDQQQQQLLAQQQAQARQQQADLAALLANPNAGPREYAAMTVKYPALREQFKQASEMLGSEQQKGQLGFMTQTYAAALSGRNDLAEQLIRDRATAMRNSGSPEQEVRSTELWADMIKQAPEQARHLGGLMLAGVMGPEKFAETFGKLGAEQRAAEQAPGALRKVNADASAAEAEAQSKSVAAKYAEQTVLKGLEEQGWKIENIKSEIGYRKDQTRIAAMNAALSRESNDLKRQELQLKVQEARSALDEKARAKVAEVESATTTIDNFLNTADRIIAAGVGADGKPNSTLRAATGPIDSRIPTVQTDVANIEALVETLGSQSFQSQVSTLKGMGNLSDAEGRKMQAALTNLSLSQGADQLLANVKEAQRLVMKARKNVETRYGIKAPAPDTPAVQTPAADIDALVKKYGGG